MTGTRAGLRGAVVGAAGVVAASAVLVFLGGQSTRASTVGAARGGTLTAYTSLDFEELDPGEAYFEQDYTVAYATQRPLFWYLPGTTATLSPDLATEVPSITNGEITNGGRTVTVHIRPDVRFSPPVDRTATSGDVAYAIERGANPHVDNPYFYAYFGDLVGLTNSYEGGPLKGIQTPNATTIVFHLSKPTAALLIGALSLPLSAPVPASFAAPMDVHDPTTYGRVAEVATGPYMIESNSHGVFQGTGYERGRSLTLVRNPDYDAASGVAPAYLNQIDVVIGGTPQSIGPQVLAGRDGVELDTPDPTVVQQGATNMRSQVTFTAGAGDHYAAVDSAHGPFANVDVRRALWAALDRDAIVKALGSSLAQPMTHFLYPGVPGFSAAGGAAGPQVPWNVNLGGSPTVARTYMKLAGYRSGSYTGGARITMVGTNQQAGPVVAHIFDTALAELGFHTHVLLVPLSEMYTRYCGQPAMEVDVCPSVGWIRDFGDPATVLDPTFNGEDIVAQSNTNWGQFDDPQINAAMDSAALVVNPVGRAAAWAGIDRMLVQEAAAIPEEWDVQANLEGANVAGVGDAWNGGSWDLSFTSLLNPGA